MPTEWTLFSVENIAKVCKRHNIAHVINNAYGVQASKCAHIVNEAMRERVDAFIQSTDKNFLVPVGGAIVASSDATLIEKVGRLYAGRASSSPIVDLFITLLSMGQSGWKQHLNNRKEVYNYLLDALYKLAEKHGERVLKTPNNPISIAMTLSNLQGKPTYLGAMLFSRCCSGSRIVAPGPTKEVSGLTFKGYGAHIDNYPYPYMTFAGAIGMSKSDVDLFLSRLDKTLEEYKKKQKTSNEPDME